MNDTKFEALVARLEPFARSHPSNYRLRVTGIALLGDLFLWGMLLLLIASVGACIWFIAVLKAAGIKLIVFLAPLAWVLGRALWVVIPPPEGLRVTRKEAPELFALIDEVQQNIGAPRFHEVIIDSDFNAGVVQTPRLGIFGWFRNYLIIGLPLLKTLTPEQFKAVLAHEYGHLAGGHAKLSNWIYRQRQRWSRLLQSLEARDWDGGALFTGFMKRYVPYLNAYSFPLARANEYEADAVAVRTTSVPAMAQALSAVKVAGNYLSETFWPRVYRGAHQSPIPDTPYTRLSEHLHADKADIPHDRWLGEAMRVKTSLADTHPSLSDRLEAIGGAPELHLPAPGCAADQLLGAALASVTKRLDTQWSKDVMDFWRSRFEDANRDRETLTKLNERYAAGESLEFDELFQRALLLDRAANDMNASVASLRDLHFRKPKAADVTFALATRLLLQDDSSGIPMLEKLIELNMANAVPCGEAIYDFYVRHDRQEEARELAKRINLLADQLSGAEKERAVFLISDELMPHGLDEEIRDVLRQQIQEIKDIAEVYLVQKRCLYLPEQPLYIVGFSIQSSWKWGREGRVAAVMELMRNKVEYPGETLVIPLNGENKRFLSRMKKVEGARLL